MSNTLVFIFLAVLAGAMIPAQAATNNKMAMTVDSPIVAAFLSFTVGTLSLFLYVIASGTSVASFAQAKNAAPVAWIGGILGAFFVTASVALIPRLGVALTFSLIIAGQMIATLIIDHFGLLDVPVKEISLARLGGILLIMIGVILIRKF